MRATSRTLRVLRFLALLVQLAVPALATVADARFDIAGASEPTHVESDSYDCNYRGHGQDCALCQYIRTAALPERPTAPVDLSRRTASVESTAPHRAVVDPIAHPLPRGPPRLS